jgi:hypothetical protein
MNEDLLRAKLYLRVVIPLLKDLIEENEKLKNSIRNWNCIIQIEIKEENLGVHLIFKDGNVEVKNEIHPSPTISLIFKDAKSMVLTFSGKKNVIPKIKGIKHFILLLKVLKLLNLLQILLPTKEVKNEEEKKLKVKLLLKAVVFSLQELSREDDYIKRFLIPITNKVVQWKVLPDGPAYYAVIDKGEIQGYKGISEKRPYTSIELKDLDGAYQLLTGKIEAMEGFTKQILIFRGSPEFGMKMGTMMKRVDDILNPKE